MSEPERQDKMKAVNLFLLAVMTGLLAFIAWEHIGKPDRPVDPPCAKQIRDDIRDLRIQLLRMQATEWENRWENRNSVDNARQAIVLRRIYDSIVKLEEKDLPFDAGLDRQNAELQQKIYEIYRPSK
jgi:hypothetical protein